jgi:4-amino-4-deoxy-L-arabinose transferase-like glycosyltransferase
MQMPSCRPFWLVWFFFAIFWFGALGYRHLLSAPEGRFATIAWEMVTSGDWLTPRFNGLRYLDAPILQTWGTALAFRLFGYSEFAARLIPALAGFMTVVGVYFTGRRLWGEKTGQYAAILLGSSLWWIANTHFLSLDAGISALLAGVAFAVLWAQQDRASPRENRNGMMLAWALMGLAVLQKGLLGVLVPAGSVLLYALIWRDWQIWMRLHVVKGVLLFLAVCAPWFVVETQANPGFATLFIRHEYQTALGWHDLFLWALPLLLLGSLPWLSLIPRALQQAGQAVDGRFSAGRFVLACMAVIVLESVLSAQITGLLPLFPLLTLLLAPVLAGLPAERLRWHFIPAALLGGALLVLALLLPTVVSRDAHAGAFNALAIWLGVAGVVSLLCIELALRLLRSGWITPALLALACVTLLGGQIVASGQENYAADRSGWQLAQSVRTQIHPATHLYAVSGTDDSLAFYLRQRLQLVRNTESQAPDADAGLVLDDETFHQRWLAESDAVAIVDEQHFALISRQHWPFRVIYRDARHLALTRG